MIGVSNKSSRRNRLNHWEMFDTVVTLIAILACFICIYPMWYVICMSISEPKAAAGGLVTFWPVGFSLESYKIVGVDKEFWRSFANSIGYAVIACLLMLFNTILMAYPLTRKNLWGHKWLNLFLLIPMYIGGGMIPTFIIKTKLGLYNNIWALILPGYSIWNIILFRTYLKSLPEEMSEAAFVDGATNRQMLTKILLPLSKPIIAVILIYTIVGSWNAWFDASIYTTNRDIQPVQLFLRNLLLTTSLTKRDVEMSGMTPEIQANMIKMEMTAKQLQYSMIVVVTMPILLIYPMFQKHFTKGVMLGSLKG